MPPVSADTLALYSTLPQVWQEGDAAQPVNPNQPYGFPLLCWLDGMGSQLQAIDNVVRDTPEGPGWSQVLDVTRCPTTWLPWLAQFVGLRFQPWQVTDSQRRAAIQAPGTWARGSIAGLLATIQALLKTTAGIVIHERDTSAYHLTIDIPTADLNGLTYGQLNAMYPTYAALNAAYATYANFPNNASIVTPAIQAALPAGLVATINYV